MNFGKPQVGQIVNASTYLLALIMVGLAIFGGVSGYSAIPFWDMWEGTLNFTMHSNDSGYTIWFSQHNEHRIVLARILFWIDNAFFHGQSAFLVFTNYTIVLTACLVFWLFMQRLANTSVETLTEADNRPRKMLWMFIVGWLFLWTQKENFTWAFQSQFFLAQLLPLTALFLLANSKEQDSSSCFFVACIIGTLSAGTMANGVLALPTMFVGALVMRHTALKCTSMFILAAAVNFIYFHDYKSVEAHGHLSSELISNPLGLLNYTFLYLGSPFYYLFGEGTLGKGAATFAGASLAIFSGSIAYRELLRRKCSAYVVALLFYIAFIGCTAFGTAGGRLIFGLDQALSFRYTTPAIMAWAALVIAYWGENRLHSNFAQQMLHVLTIFFVLTAAAMLNYQLKALERIDETLSVRETAALAATLNIRDDIYIKSIFPDTASVLRISSEAKKKGASIFGKYPFLNLDKEVSTPYKTKTTETCLGSLDLLEPIEGVSDYERVWGWIFSAQTKSPPKLLRFVNQQGNIVGFGLTGTPRLDVAKLIHPDGKLSGFRGYIFTSSKGSPVTIIGDNPHCNLSVDIPSAP